ncbi:hypothetical protein [Patulibacter minatonensis]|uniref:hypothetical protein n=1 Tax=Patulibacter minatonensis TaxID=298163 RepID=UPI00047C33D4|nr:hypothetical protein [Patulibacter minatonensis]
MTTKLRSTIVGAAVTAGATLAVAGQASAATTFFLDSRSPQTDGSTYVGPVGVDVIPLVPYTIKVEGAVSLYAPANWANPRFKTCGTPSATTPFPTLGVANGPVGADAIARFASVVKADGTCPSLPETTDKNFEIDTGNGFGYLGAPYSATHSYTYLVIPTKNRIAVRFYDPAAKDNYGQFKVTVSAAGIL